MTFAIGAYIFGCGIICGFDVMWGRMLLFGVGIKGNYRYICGDNFVYFFFWFYEIRNDFK